MRHAAHTKSRTTPLCMIDTRADPHRVRFLPVHCIIKSTLDTVSPRDPNPKTTARLANAGPVQDDRQKNWRHGNAQVQVPLLVQSGRDCIAFPCGRAATTGSSKRFAGRIGRDSSLITWTKIYEAKTALDACLEGMQVTVIAECIASLGCPRLDLWTDRQLGERRSRSAGYRSFAPTALRCAIAFLRALDPDLHSFQISRKWLFERPKRGQRFGRQESWRWHSRDSRPRPSTRVFGNGISRPRALLTLGGMRGVQHPDLW